MCIAMIGMLEELEFAFRLQLTPQRPLRLLRECSGVNFRGAGAVGLETECPLQLEPSQELQLLKREKAPVRLPVNGLGLRLGVLWLASLEQPWVALLDSSLAVDLARVLPGAFLRGLEFQLSRHQLPILHQLQLSLLQCSNHRQTPLAVALARRCALSSSGCAPRRRTCRTSMAIKV